MARQPRTPGATTEAPKPEAVQTTADQADAALNAILGTPDSESTSTPSEPVQEAPKPEPVLDKLEYEEFLKWKKSKSGAAQPVSQHVPTSGVGSEPVVKRIRPVLTDDGWTSEEY